MGSFVAAVVAAVDGTSVSREGDERSRRSSGFVGLGTSFRLGGLLVTASDACGAYAQEARVGQLLRDPLQWEGDPNTLVIVGTLHDVLSQGAELQAVADCAAERFSADPAEAIAGRHDPAA